MAESNPRAVVGDNRGPAAAENTRKMLERDYAALAESVQAILDRARELPNPVETEAQVALYVPVVKDLRDTRARIDAFHKAEKEPLLRSGQAVDSFFFRLWDKLARREKNRGDAGALDVLQRRLDDFAARKLKEQQERAEREAAERARIARAAQEEADRLAREAEEKRLAAERARKPETVEAKGHIAAAAEQAASAAKVEAAVASDQAYGAHVETLRRPADIVRQRTDEGMLTAGTEAYADVLDESKLDKAALWPYIGLAEKQKALRQWAKANGHTKQMDGADVGKRAKGRVI